MITDIADLLRLLQNNKHGRVYAGRFPLPYVYTPGEQTFCHDISAQLALTLDACPDLVSEVKSNHTLYRHKRYRIDS